MTLQLGQVAPDFEADTTVGRIRFHDWLGSAWGVLFSHPKDYTPVCTTELGEAARLKPEFDQRSVKVIGLSVDPVDSHAGWAKDIAETPGPCGELPDDRRPGAKVAKPTAWCTPQADGADNRPCARSCHRPGQADQADDAYPTSTGRNFDEILRVIDSLQLTDKAKLATPANWRPGDRAIIAALHPGRAGYGPVPPRVGGEEALPSLRQGDVAGARRIRGGDIAEAVNRLLIILGPSHCRGGAIRVWLPSRHPLTG